MQYNYYFKCGCFTIYNSFPLTSDSSEDVYEEVKERAIDFYKKVEGTHGLSTWDDVRQDIFPGVHVDKLSKEQVAQVTEAYEKEQIDSIEIYVEEVRQDDQDLGG